MRNEIGRKVREHRHAAEMGFQRAAAVNLVDLRSKRFVLEHDIQDIAQHFKGRDIRFRTDRRGARIEIHAGHFAKEIAGAELRDGISIGQVHGSVDRNGAIACFLLAFVVVASNQRALQAFKEALSTTVSFYVGDRRGNRYLRGAFEDIKSSRTILAFATDDVAFAEMAFNDGAAI